jgi:hypothetical protein
MLNFPPTVRIWLGTQAVDLRKSFDSLAEQVRQHLHNDPLSGHLFVFRNKRGDRVKLLYWDEDGFVIVYKRLEEGTFPAIPGKCWVAWESWFGGGHFRKLLRAARQLLGCGKRSRHEPGYLPAAPAPLPPL